MWENQELKFLMEVENTFQMSLSAVLGTVVLRSFTLVILIYLCKEIVSAQLLFTLAKANCT